MNERQTELARHALGLKQNSIMSYRNAYIIGAHHPDHAVWMQMVAAGDAERRDGKHLSFGGDDLFHVTYQGAKKCLLPEETLDREDFPTALAGR